MDNASGNYIFNQAAKLEDVIEQTLILVTLVYVWSNYYISVIILELSFVTEKSFYTLLCDHAIFSGEGGE